jgi:hypothetical protein
LVHSWLQQLWPKPHMVLHLPQLVGTPRLVSHPSANVPLQSAKPLVQLATTQTRAWHAAVAFEALHCVPQAPQFATSRVRSAQPSGQLVWPAGQPHAPPVQVMPAGHACAHIPQLAASVCVSTQWSPQLVSPAPQTHLPLVQVMPAEQTWAHIPQFVASACVSTQWPLQVVSPVLHTHALFAQTVPSPQVCAHAAQFIESTRVSTQ